MKTKNLIKLIEVLGGINYVAGPSVNDVAEIKLIELIKSIEIKGRSKNRFKINRVNYQNNLIEALTEENKELAERLKKYENNV